ADVAQPRELRPRPGRREGARDCRGACGPRHSRPRPLVRSRVRWLHPHHRRSRGRYRAPRARLRGGRMRRAVIARDTRETSIRLKLTVEGRGRYDVSTGIRFFDHMLELFTRHGAFDLTLKVTGDLDVDQHHSVEDTGI